MLGRFSLYVSGHVSSVAEEPIVPRLIPDLGVFCNESSVDFFFFFFFSMNVVQLFLCA